MSWRPPSLVLCSNCPSNDQTTVKHLCLASDVHLTHLCCGCFFFLFFKGIDLENIVYYKDDTHYFVMTAKKQSLLEKGVILHVSARRNPHFASLMQINSEFLRNLERPGPFSFGPFVFVFPFCFPNDLTQPEPRTIGGD